MIGLINNAVLRGDLQKYHSTICGKLLKTKVEVRYPNNPQYLLIDNPQVARRASSEAIRRVSSQIVPPFLYVFFIEFFLFYNKYILFVLFFLFYCVLFSLCTVFLYRFLIFVSQFVFLYNFFLFFKKKKTLYKKTSKQLK